MPDESVEVKGSCMEANDQDCATCLMRWTVKNMSSSQPQQAAPSHHHPPLLAALVSADNATARAARRRTSFEVTELDHPARRIFV